MVQVESERRQRIVLGAFVLSALVTCVLVALWPGSIPYRLAKVMPLLLLSITRFREPRDHLARFVGFGLFASFLGDVVIDSQFIAGIGAFLVGHIFYIIAMGLPGRTMGVWAAMVPALLFGNGMYQLLVGSGRAPEPLRIPVTIYAAVISTMLGRAIGRAFALPKDRASRIFLAGALLFVLSDSMIGINRWVTPIPLGRVWIMATYYAGQWWIYWSSRRQENQAPA